MQAKSTHEMFMNSWVELYVNSQKSQARLMLGSEGLETDGSTSAGPGLSRNVIGVPMENHSLAPASCGTVIVTGDPPGAFSGMAQFTASGDPVPDGEDG